MRVSARAMSAASRTVLRLTGLALLELLGLEPGAALVGAGVGVGVIGRPTSFPASQDGSLKDVSLSSANLAAPAATNAARDPRVG
jgi:hypothetical protein